MPPIAAPAPAVSTPAPAAVTPAPAPAVAASTSTPPVATSTPPAVETKASAPKPEEPAAKNPNGAATAEETSSPDKEGDEERARRPFSNTRADSPQAKGERARSQVRASVPPGDGGSTSRWLVLSLVIAGVIMAGRLFFQHRPASAPAAEPPVPPAAPAASEAPAAETATAAPAAAPSATVATPEASAAPTPAASAEAAPSASAAASASAEPSAGTEGTRVVIVKISPPQARLFYKGKPVGSSPVTVELAPGEKKRSFEVGMPGWVTRRLVVDGTKSEVFIGLKPE